jgi:hypothetical protein
MTNFGLRLSLIGLIGLGAVCAQTPKASFSLVIDTADKNVKAGSEIQIDIVLTNASDHRVVVVKSGPNAEISGNLIVMRGSSGRVPPFTKQGRATLGREEGMVGSSVQASLEPGQGTREQAWLHQLFELAPDTYTVFVERKDRDTGAVARSNSITITVTGEHKTASFGLIVNSDKKAYTAGADIPIDITLTNNSDRALQLANAGANAELGGSYLVVRGTGVRPPRKTRDGWMRLEHPSATAGKPEMVAVQRGAALKEQVLLNRLFDLPPDTYQVSVERRDQETGIVAQSNVIAITVTAGGAK